MEVVILLVVVVMEWDLEIMITYDIFLELSQLTSSLIFKSKKIQDFLRDNIFQNIYQTRSSMKIYR